MAIPTHAWFVVGEIMVLPNSAMPKEGHYFNIVLWTTFIILSYLGWKESGAVLPDTDALIPKGRFGTPLLVWAINNTISYGLPLVLLRDKMMEQYAVDSFMAGFTPDVKFLIDTVLGNTGKLFINNTAGVIAICSVEPTNEDTLYRLSRVASSVGFYYLGAFAIWANVNLLGKSRGEVEEEVDVRRSGCARSSLSRTAPSSPT